MSTIYTFNGKVLKNSANDKWLTKKEAPAIEEVVIGSQTWMKTNLAIDDGGEGITIINNNYYYTQAAAQRVAQSVTGWHLPTKEEFTTLKTNGNGFTGLASTDSWTYGGGTNSSGFTALPVGDIYYYDGQHRGEGTGASYWSSTSAYYMGLWHTEYDGQGATVTYNNGSNGYSVRLIKDT